MSRAANAGGQWEQLLERLLEAELVPQTGLLLETFFSDR